MFSGMYPELHSSAIFAALTLEAIHLPLRALLAIAGKKKQRSRWGMDVLEVEAGSKGWKGCEICSFCLWSLYALIN
jgi:hypothetical protein